MATLFISDLHLDESRPAVTHALLNFLNDHAGHCDALYILGDLFESWIGDDDESTLSIHVCRALRAFNATGAKIYVMHGNRDFLLGNEFCKQSCAILLHDSSKLMLEGRPTLLMHGDTLCTRDRDYQAFRLKVRDPEYQRELLSLPLAERRKIAASLRQMSHKATSNKAADIMDVTPSEVIQTMETNDSTLLIHGHTHRPARHKVKLKNTVGERIVLGDWARKGWYIRAANGAIELQNFTINR